MPGETDLSEVVAADNHDGLCAGCEHARHEPGCCGVNIGTGYLGPVPCQCGVAERIAELEARQEPAQPDVEKRAAKTCPRCEKPGAKVTKARGDSTSYRCGFCGKRFRVAYDGR